MKHSEPLNYLSTAKRLLAAKVFDSLMAVQDIISVTFVGSFYDRDDMSGISDVDVVVIGETLLQPFFEQCVSVIAKLTGEDLGFPGKRVYINSSFGPLKFDTPEQIVIHLMIYDRDGHRRHVLSSPFTCMDWERSPVYMGISLREVYPVLSLQPGDFFYARRGLEDYLNDLEQGTLSYRVYEFDQLGKPLEVKKNITLDARHSGEYAYHIVKNLISNYAKLLFQKNIILAQNDFYNFWNRYFVQGKHLIPHFQEWERLKRQRRDDFPATVVPYTKEFLLLFGNLLQDVWGGQAQRIIFTRHAKTEYNNGSFLGQGRDPDIAENMIEPLRDDFVCIYSSPFKRAIRTAEKLTHANADVRIDERLSEQNYGEAEGLTIQQVQVKFPEMTAGWQQGLDVRFPGGENTADVEARLFFFLREIATEHGFPKLVVTHNVVLRCLLGKLLALTPQNWYKLNPAHLDLFELILPVGDYPQPWYLNLTKSQRTGLIDNVMKTGLHISST
jgi:ribonuclease H / adenosylcobalamin/alpha-ribazole phosphatase